MVVGVRARAERPLETEDAVPLDPGHVQTEVSVNFARGPGTTNLGTFIGVLAVGLLPGLDLAAQGLVGGLDEPGRSPHAGVGDTTFQSKWLVAEETTRRPALLLSPVVRVPTGDVRLGLPGVDVQLIGVAEKTIGAWTLTANLDYTFVTANRRRDATTLATSAVWVWTQAWSLAGEVIGDVGTFERSRDHVTVRAGPIWKVRDGVALDAAIAGGAKGEFPYLQVTVGATIDLF